MPLVDYFYANTDNEAAMVLDLRGGPAIAGHNTVSAKGVDPVVTLGTLAEILTDRTFDEITDDPRHGALVAEVGDGSAVVVTVTDGLRDVLATTDRTTLAEAAAEWIETEELLGASATDMTEFLEEFADLARDARERDRHVYCWWCL